MKKILGFLLLLSITQTLKATHLRGGEILYKRLGSNSSTYSFTVVVYMDDGSNVADRCSLLVKFGDGDSSLAYRINGPTGSCCPSGVGCGQIISNSNYFIIKKCIYTVTHTYTSNGTYTASLLDVNRSGDVVNFPNSINLPFYIESTILVNNLGANSSPVPSNIACDQGFLFNSYSYNGGAVDEEGDSLSYQLIPCKLGFNQPVPGYTLPSTNFNINSTTGLVQGTISPYQGYYNYAVEIKEWRRIGCSNNYQFMGSITRDIQISISHWGVVSLTAQNLTDTCVVVNTNLSRGLSISSNTNVVMSLNGVCTNTIFTPTAIVTPTLGAGTFNANFLWTPSCSLINYQPNQVTISARTTSLYDLGLRTNTQFNIKVLPPAPLIQNITIDTNKVTLRWSKVNTCSNLITGYNIYRKAGTNNWNHSNCENGVPPTAGFNLIATANPNDSVFVDTNFGTIQNGTDGHYIITSVMKNCVESFANVNSLNFVIGLNEYTLTDNDVKISPNPFTSKLEIALAKQTNRLHLTLTSADGRVIIEEMFSKPDTSVTVDSKGLAIGIYFLKIETQEGKVVKKVIRQ